MNVHFKEIFSDLLYSSAGFYRKSSGMLLCTLSGDLPVFTLSSDVLMYTLPVFA